MVGNCRSSGARLMVSLICGLALQGGAVRLGAKESRPPAQQGAAARSVGTVKTISGKSITLTTDAGGDISVLLQEDARILRVEPGQKDLKDAAPFSLQDLQPGDRVLVRGKMADDGKSLLAASLIAMKKMDIAQKQAHEREEWQKHGVGGLVSAVDPSNGTIAITTTAPTPRPGQPQRRWQRTHRRRSRVWLLPQHRRHDCLHRFRGWNDYGDGLGHQETGGGQSHRRIPVAQTASSHGAAHCRTAQGDFGRHATCRCGPTAGGIIRNERHCRNALERPT